MNATELKAALDHLALQGIPRQRVADTMCIPVGWLRSMEAGRRAVPHWLARALEWHMAGLLDQPFDDPPPPLPTTARRAAPKREVASPPKPVVRDIIDLSKVPSGRWPPKPGPRLLKQIDRERAAPTKISAREYARIQRESFHAARRGTDAP